MKKDEEEIEQKADERRRKGQDPDWDVILNRTSTAPLVVSHSDGAVPITPSICCPHLTNHTFRLSMGITSSINGRV
jgi:hypothetical protein